MGEEILGEVGEMRLDYLEEDVPVLVCFLGVSLLVVQKLIYFAAWMGGVPRELRKVLALKCL